MTRTISLPLATLLPEADGCAGCGDRLGTALVASGTALDAHPSATGDRLIVHVPPATPVETITAAARQHAAGLARRYIHRTLPIAGMDCADCARTLGDGVAALPGV
ncbi:MAG: cation transporter, partial [Chloroflexi bacterium]|nr:cation transporter [Chloroflexota bacterium]